MASSMIPQPSTTLSASAIPLSFKPKHIPTIKNPDGRYKISCKSTDKNQESSSTSSSSRRDMLIGLGATTISAPFSLASPIQGPDVTDCHPATPDFPHHCPPSPAPIPCCPPQPSRILDFKFPKTELHSRPAAHLVNEDYIEKFNSAVEMMRGLDDNDPRSFTQQANVHCAYCNGAYGQAGYPNLDLQIHSSWLFFPFHRCYLYFFERILGKLIDDPGFRIPFWNWDSPEGMTIPLMYTIPSSPLYDRLRDGSHQPPVLVDLNFGHDHNVHQQPDHDALVNRNLRTMYRQMILQSKTPCSFFGRPYRRCDAKEPGAGSIELIPHNTIHNWTGDPKADGEDMGDFFSAARDPIFYAHHANIDRMWTLWKSLGKRRQDIRDPDFLDASFLFYDENGEMVRIMVRDCLNTTKLGYDYENVDIPWNEVEYRPNPSRSFSSVSRSILIQRKIRFYDRPEDILPASLIRDLKILVKRPTKQEREQDPNAEEILVIKGIELESDVYAKFDVYINHGYDEKITAEYTEFAGSFVNVPHKHKRGKKIKTQLRLSIADILNDLRAEKEDKPVLVTLAPIVNGDAVTIDGIKIELDDYC